VSLNIAKHLGLNVENYFSFKKALDIAQPFVPPQLTNLIWKYGVKVKKKKKKRKRTNIYFFSIYFPLNLLFISYIDCPGWHKLLKYRPEAIQLSYKTWKKPELFWNSQETLYLLSSTKKTPNSSMIMGLLEKGQLRKMLPWVACYFLT